MRKTILLGLTTLLLTLTLTLPAAAHGGEASFLPSGLSGNMTLFGASSVLALLILGLFYLNSPNSGAIWEYGIVGLGAIVTFIHVGVGLRGEMLLLLNGLGYMVLVAALYVPFPFIKSKRQTVRWVLVGYTAVTFFGYLLSHDPSMYDRLGLLTKVLEFGFAANLILRIWQVRGETAVLKKVSSPVWGQDHSVGD